MNCLQSPFTESAIRALRVGDLVRVRGLVFTGRDRLHQYLAEGGESPVDLHDAALYHCGPVVVPVAEGWRVMAAGPTTSIREEPYMPTIIEKLGVRVIIGKGGMGAATLTACQKFGCLYLQAVGGAAALLAQCVKQVEKVYFLERFGATEAMWKLQVFDFDAVVGMDAHGGNLFKTVQNQSGEQLHRLQFNA